MSAIFDYNMLPVRRIFEAARDSRGNPQAMTDETQFRKAPLRSFQERLAAAIALQQRIIVALFIRETRTRFGYSMLGYGWVLLEPAFNLIVWAVLFNMLERHPPLGASMFIFVATAFFPFKLFRNMSAQLMPSITANRSLLSFPIVHNLDVIMARALLEVITFIAVTGFYFSLFGIFGLQAVPAQPIEAMLCLSAIGLFGFGMGTINAVLACLLPSWPRIYPWYLRVSYVSSGIFFLPSHLPPAAQDILWYLPMTHAVEWFRVAFYDGYESTFLNTTYLVAWGALLTFVGLALERLLRRSISIAK